IGKNIIDAFNIIDRSRGEGAYRPSIELAEVEPKNFSINGYPHVAHNRLAQPGRGIGKPKAHRGFYQYQANLDQRNIDHHPLYRVGNIIVYRYLYQVRPHRS